MGLLSPTGASAEVVVPKELGLDVPGVVQQTRGVSDDGRGQEEAAHATCARSGSRERRGIILNVSRSFYPQIR